MTTLNKVFDLSNLRRAYRWTMSNPDGTYKSYFRDSYDAFAIASDTHLKWVRAEGLKDRYEVSHASKVLVPKPSGVLRPIALLKVEDQIVYQAIINLIAEELKNVLKIVMKNVYSRTSMQENRRNSSISNGGEVTKNLETASALVTQMAITILPILISHHSMTQLITMF